MTAHDNLPETIATTPAELTTNPMAPEEVRRICGDMLRHPRVVRMITFVLRSFDVEEQDVEDGVAQVQLRALEYVRRRPLPASVDEWVSLCVVMTRNWRLKVKDKAERIGDTDAGLVCEDPDAYLQPPVAGGSRERLDAVRVVRVLEEMFENGQMPALGDEILDCRQAGMSFEEVGAELGIDGEDARSRWRRMRDKLRRRLRTLGITAAALGAVALLAMGGVTVLARGDDDGASSEVRVRVADVRVRVDAVEEGERLRVEALRECARHRWEVCLARVEQAAQIDPEGDALPEAQGLRQLAQQGLTDSVVPMLAKPRGW